MSGGRGVPTVERVRPTPRHARPVAAYVVTRPRHGETYPTEVVVMDDGSVWERTPGKPEWLAAHHVPGTEEAARAGAERATDIPGPWTWRNFGAGWMLTTAHGGAKVVLTAGTDEAGRPALMVRDEDGILEPITPDHWLAEAMLRLAPGGSP